MIKKKILLVDDDPNLVLMTKSRLEASDFDVMSVQSGIEAIKAAEELKPDLIILDILMPAMEGIEVCHHLKAGEETRKIPVIVISGCNQKEVHARCIQAGALVVVMKPFSASELLALIKKAFDPESKWRKAKYD